MPVATEGWVVYDVETDKVIGKWEKYSDAMQFWGDVLNCDDANWQVFPAGEVYDSEEEWHSGLHICSSPL